MGSACFYTTPPPKANRFISAGLLLESRQKVGCKIRARVPYWNLKFDGRMAIRRHGGIDIPWRGNIMKL